MTYDTWKCTPPDDERHDPHEGCEHALDRAESEIAALKADARMTYAELVAMVAAMLPAESFVVEVSTHYSQCALPSRRTRWAVTYDFHTTTCKRFEADSAREVYDKLRNAVPAPDPHGVDAVGDIPW